MLARTPIRTDLLSTPVGRKKRTDLLITEIDRRRRDRGLTIGRLCAAAGLRRETYHAAVKGVGVTRPRTLRKLSAALDALAANRTPITIDVVTSLTATSFRAFFNAACLRLRIRPVEARAELDKPGERAADPAWHKASRARGIALYLTNTAQGVRQGDLARLTGLTPAAVSIAIAKVSDALDGRFEAMLDKIEQEVTGKV